MDSEIHELKVVSISVGPICISGALTGPFFLGKEKNIFPEYIIDLFVCKVTLNLKSALKK